MCFAYRIWDLKLRKVLLSIDTGHKQRVWALQALHNGCIASGGEDGDVKIWNDKYKVITHSFPFFFDVLILLLMRCLFWYAVCGSIHTQLCASLSGHTGAVRCLTAVPGRVLSGSSDGSVRVWDTSTFECLAVLDPLKGAPIPISSNLHCLICEW